MEDPVSSTLTFYNEINHNHKHKVITAPFVAIIYPVIATDHVIKLQLEITRLSDNCRVDDNGRPSGNNCRLWGNWKPCVIVHSLIIVHFKQLFTAQPVATVITPSTVSTEHYHLYSLWLFYNVITLQPVIMMDLVIINSFVITEHYLCSLSSKQAPLILKTKNKQKNPSLWHLYHWTCLSCRFSGLEI